MTVVLPDQPLHLDVPITSNTADALDLVMRTEEVSPAQATRRLVGYGALVFRTVRLEGGEVLLRHGRDVQHVVLLDVHGDPLVWMRPRGSTVAYAFSSVALAVRNRLVVESIARCDEFVVADLVADDQAERCLTCLRLVARWGAL